MSAYAPTLIPAVTKAQLEETDVTLENLRAALIGVFNGQDFVKNVAFNALRVVVAGTEGDDNPIILENFVGVVVAKYELNGEFLLKLATGDIVTLDFIIL